MMSVGLHPRPVGHPGRFRGLRRFVRRLAGQDGIRVARRIDIARHRMTVHPPDRRQSGDGPRMGEDG